MTNRALSADTARKTQLEECELKIRSAFRRGLEATCLIATELHKILRDELYKEVTPEFKEYLAFKLQIDERSYRRIILVSQTVALLKEAGLQLPANESQAAELGRLDAELRPRVWNELVVEAERQDKTLILDDVRQAVEAVESRPAPKAPKRSGSVEVEMQDNGSEPPTRSKSKPEEPVQEAELILTEKGEAALNRIRKVCGNEIADAIEDGTRSLTEREIRNWAEYDDAMMRMLTYYVIDRGWPLSKAVSFETRHQQIEDSTDVSELILIASARGGSALILHNKARITIELV